MRKIQELLRLKYEQKQTHRDIATSLNVSPGTVSHYLKQAKRCDLNWPLPESLQNDEALYPLLFPNATRPRANAQSCPDWQQVHEELKQHKHVTLMLLWEDYRQTHPDGISYSCFCQHYRQYVSQLDVTMRQHHTYGEKCFVDYAGVSVEWIDATTGETSAAQIFVGVLGASNYTYVEATHSQTLRDWIGSHCRMFEYFNGVPQVVVPDNLKSGVTKAHHYDPDINPSYQDFATHYGVAVIPTRVRAPKDKAKAEVGVQGIERRLLAPLRHRQFFSVAEVNDALNPLLEDYNQKPFQKYDGSRRELFTRHEKATLKPLPATRYQYAQWRKAKAGIDYHVAIDKHYYSVPYPYAAKVLDVRISMNTVDCLYKQKKIATHRRALKPGYTTEKAHMPKSHQAYAEWTPQRLTEWAATLGEHTQQLIKAIIAARPIPQQAFRCCLGVLRLGEQYSHDRLGRAAKRANAIGAIRYQSIASILKKGLDKLPLPQPPSTAQSTPAGHDNVRGQSYYQ